MRFIFFIFTCAVIVSLLSACNIPTFEQTDPTRFEFSETMSVESSQDYESVECAFMWASDPLPELSAEFNHSLQETLLNSKGYAEAYGENCVTVTGEVVRFLAMETDYHITLKVDELEDEQVLGDLVVEVMGVMAEFPTDTTPGPQPGYIGITFESPEDSFRLWVMRADVEAALENGLRGEALLNALQTK